MRYALDDAPFSRGTGKGITVAVVDSGVHANHPHLEGASVSGVSLVDPLQATDWVDRLGHGTAVAAAIHEKAPEAALIAIRVFDRALTTSARTLADAIMHAADRGAHLINLSLGTANHAHRELLGEAVTYAIERGSIVVSAHEFNGQTWLPGSLNQAIGVLLDTTSDRNAITDRTDDAMHKVYAASGYPRPIPGVPVERNLSGISFAVANVTGFLARLEDTENLSAFLGRRSTHIR